MRRIATLALALVAVAAPVATAAPAAAQNYGYGYAPPAPPPPPPPPRDGWRQDDYSWRGDADGRWDPYSHYRERERRRLSYDDRVYRGGDGRYYCRRSDGTTGLVLGAVGGGVLGDVLGGGTLGTILGAGGGAILGRSLDRRHDDAQNRRNGYYCD